MVGLKPGLTHGARVKVVRAVRAALSSAQRVAAPAVTRTVKAHEATVGLIAQRLCRVSPLASRVRQTYSLMRPSRMNSSHRRATT